MFSLHAIYRPITSRPRLSDRSYMECPPCPALLPFVTCYWGTWMPQRGLAEHINVIPDGCVDMLVEINHTRGTMQGFFAGMQEGPFSSVQPAQDDLVSNFAIRFPFWSIHMITQFSLREVAGQVVDLELAFPVWARRFRAFFNIVSLQERIQYVERLLYTEFDARRYEHNLLNVAYHILSSRGAGRVQEACGYATVSQRQMERLFLRDAGLSIKKVSDIVRYQSMWREMVFSERFDLQDAVYRYGFADQAHLLHNFYRHHGMYPRQAVDIVMDSTQWASGGTEMRGS